jgi:hypothetical protein
MTLPARLFRIVGVLGSLLLAGASTLAATDTYNVREYGAVGDGSPSRRARRRSSSSA